MSQRTVEGVEYRAHDEWENTETKLQKNLEVNYEKIDESNELLSKALKFQNGSKGIMLGFVEPSFV